MLEMWIYPGVDPAVESFSSCAVELLLELLRYGSHKTMNHSSWVLDDNPNPQCRQTLKMFSHPLRSIRRFESIM